MKILLMHAEEEVDAAGHLCTICEKMNIPVEKYPLKSSGDVDIKKTHGLFLGPDSGDQEEHPDAPTHAFIVSPLTSSLFFYLAGLACGSHIPFLVYGVETIVSLPREIKFCFTLLETEDSLNGYLKAESESFKKHEAAGEIAKARDALLQMGVPVNDESLAQCSGDGSVQEVSLFLAAGYSPDTKNKAGVPLLCVAARNGKEEILKLLIQSGAQVNLIAEDRGGTAVIDSALGNHLGMINDLIEAGADVNIQSKDGQTALVVAVGAGEEGIVEALLKAGADPDISDSLGASARKYANLFHKSSMMALFEKYAPPKAV